MPSSLFGQVQSEMGPYLPAPSASAAALTMSTAVHHPPYGMVPLHDAKRMAKGASSTQQETYCARIGNNQTVAPQPHTTPVTSAPDAASRLMELKIALERKKLNAASPYKPDAWRKYLHAAGLHHKYPNIPHDLQFGFDAGIRPISQTFIPPNRPSITQYSTEFNNIIQTELQKERYIGPVTQEEAENLLGVFQTSPLSIIPKPGRPGKFRLIQNLSSPHSPLHSITSINSSIDSDQYPCTWGTFSTICLLIRRLPPGSQAAVRDVKEAYRTIPIKPEQWPGLVVRLHEEDSFAIDTRDCFGLASGGGVYGLLGDAGAQIMRSHGIGPLSKWVDDHIFFRILCCHLKGYNLKRKQWAQDIGKNGGEIHDGGRLWFRGATMPNGQPEEFDEDLSFDIQDRSHASKRSVCLLPCTAPPPFSAPYAPPNPFIKPISQISRRQSLHVLHGRH